MSTFIFFSAWLFKTICLKHGCLCKAYCIECGFLMADFDEMSHSCENDKVEISAYERIKVIFFMTETFHIMELLFDLTDQSPNRQSHIWTINYYNLPSLYSLTWWGPRSVLKWIIRESWRGSLGFFLRYPQFLYLRSFLYSRSHHESYHLVNEWWI